MRIVLYLSSLFFLFSTPSLQGEEEKGEWTRAEVEANLERFFFKSEEVRKYFVTNENGIAIFDSLGEERKVVHWIPFTKEKVKESSKRKRRSVKGIKIAIDPGHLGGVYAQLEKRYIEIPPSLNWKEPIAFNEGTLTYLTALHLKTILEKEGMSVLLTREGIGKGAYEEGFFDWMKKHPSIWSSEESLSKIFRSHYNVVDLIARAEKINAFSPDLTIIIHYNSGGDKEDKKANHRVTSENYNLTFIPGAFLSEELNSERNRLELVRLLTSDDLERSEALARAIMKAFSRHLDVPPISKDSEKGFSKVAIGLGEGVFARNLALTRLVHGPLCYGETLIQNNIDEAQNLNRKDWSIQGIRCSSRIRQVAEAYFEGIMNYLLELEEKELVQVFP